MDPGATESFGELLRQLREAAGLSQEALAARAGLSADAIGLLERGQRRRPRTDTVRRLVAALNLEGPERERFEASAESALGEPDRREPTIRRALDRLATRYRRDTALAVARLAIVLIVVTGVLARPSGLAAPAPSDAPFLLPSPLPTPSSRPAAAPLPCWLPIDRGGRGAFARIPVDGVRNGVIGGTQVLDDGLGSPRLPDGEDPVEVTYRWDLGRWLPVRADWIAPDHLHYAFSDREGRVHVIGTADNQDRVVNGDRQWVVLSYQPEGIYAGVPSDTGTTTGLWLIDPASGNARRLQSGGAWQLVGGGAAWSLAITPPSVSPPRIPRDHLYGNTVRRLDLHTGRTTTMYRRHDAQLHMVGLDADGNAYVSPLTLFAAPLVEIVAVERTVDFAGDSWVNVSVDGDRAWLGGNASTAVYVKDSAGLRPVASMGGGQVRIAGECG